MAEKVKSAHCEVCGRQSRFTKETKKRGSKMMSQASSELNPLKAVSSLMIKAGGSAMDASKSYRCVTCGSKLS